jgi:fumarate reductase flavoprotein subunit
MAKAIGCDASLLAQTLHDVADAVVGKQADAFGRDFGGKPPLAPSYYLARVTGALFHTQGGLEVDTCARVLRKDGTPFPNLFAGGGAARGLSGPADWGYLSGSGLLMATNLGRLAGETAADLVKR